MVWIMRSILTTLLSRKIQIKNVAAKSFLIEFGS